MQIVDGVQVLSDAVDAFNAGNFAQAERLAAQAASVLDGLWLGRALLVRGNARFRRELYDDETLSYLRSASDLLTRHGEHDSAAGADQLAYYTEGSQWWERVESR
jgi:hypothetical protein